MDFRFVEFPPPAALAPVLRRSFFARGRIPYRADRIMPNGLAVAVFNLGRPHRVGKSETPERNPRFRHSWLHGVQTTPIFNLPEGETHVLGLLFEPLGFHARFGTDMRGLADRTVDAREVLPADVIGAVERGLTAPDSRAAHDAVHRALMAAPTANVRPWLRSLYGGIKTTDGTLRLDRVYDATGCSARHVGARFKRAVGVTPKVLCRIYRLQALLEAIDPATAVNWTGLAHQFGFYDQAHFNREFRRFAGLTPRQYLAWRRRDLPDLGKGESVHFAPQR